VERCLQRGSGVGGVVEVEREVAALDVRLRVRRVDGLEAEVERGHGLLLETEIAAADDDDRVAALLLQLEACRVAGGVPDLTAAIEALRQARVRREAGTTVAVPEDVGVLGDEARQWLGDLRCADDDDVDTLLRQ